MTRYHRFESFKVLAHSDKIKEIIAGGMPAPVEWVIYPSNACSYKCGHCIMAEEKDAFQARLPQATMNKIAPDAVRMGIKTVIFSGGGDPLLNQGTMFAARELKNAGVKVGLNNQGYFLDDATAFDFVRFSVDAATNETYQKIHKVTPEAWVRVNANIRKAQDVDGLELGLAFLVTPTNYDEVEAFCEWAQQYRYTYLHLRPAFLDAPYLDAHYPGGDKALREIVPKLSSLANRLSETYRDVYFRVDKFDGFWTKKTYGKCRATPLMAVTAADGSFLICQDKFMRWGDYNTQTFEDIWYSDAHQNVIDSIDLTTCPRCVENGYNEIIEHVFLNDGMRLNLI